MTLFFSIFITQSIWHLFLVQFLRFCLLLLVLLGDFRERKKNRYKYVLPFTLLNEIGLTCSSIDWAHRAALIHKQNKTKQIQISQKHDRKTMMNI